MDNRMMENFSGKHKTEMFYEQEDNYKTLNDLIKIFIIITMIELK